VLKVKINLKHIANNMGGHVNNESTCETHHICTPSNGELKITSQKKSQNCAQLFILQLLVELWWFSSCL